MDASGELAPLSSFASFDIASSGILLSTPGPRRRGGSKQQMVSKTSHRYLVQPLPGTALLVSIPDTTGVSAAAVPCSWTLLM